MHKFDTNKTKFPCVETTSISSCPKQNFICLCKLFSISFILFHFYQHHIKFVLRGFIWEGKENIFHFLSSILCVGWFLLLQKYEMNRENYMREQQKKSAKIRNICQKSFNSSLKFNSIDNLERKKLKLIHFHFSSCHLRNASLRLFFLYFFKCALTQLLFETYFLLFFFKTNYNCFLSCVVSFTLVSFIKFEYQENLKKIHFK